MRKLACLLFFLTTPTGMAQALEKPSPQLFILGENGWSQSDKNGARAEATIDPATTHLTLKAPAGAKASQLSAVIEKTYVSSITSITLVASDQPGLQVTYRTADLADFIKAANHPNRGGIDPTAWGFDAFLAHGANGITFDIATEMHVALKSPLTARDFGQKLDAAFKKKGLQQNNRQVMFVSHLDGTLSEIIELMRQLKRHKLDRILLVADNKLIHIMQIEVKQDINVEPPLAGPAAKKAKRSRFIVHITGEGSLHHGGKQASDDELEAEMKKFKARHPNAVVHLRAAEGVSFKHIRHAIRIAAGAGLDNVVFSVYKGHPKNAATDPPGPLKKLVEDTIKPRQQDLKMSLPAASPPDAAAMPVLEPLFIKIGNDGVIFVNRGKGQEALDADAGKRDLPQLKERIRTYVAIAKAGGQEPMVQIWADKNARQQRVVDVVNALAASKIKKVVFVDLLDE